MQQVDRVARPWSHVIFIASVGAAASHFAASSAHLLEYRPAGVFMLVTGIVQGATGIRIKRSESRAICDGALVLNVSLIVLWAWTRAVGMPLGPDAGVREDIHLQDGLAVVLEAIAVGALYADARGLHPSDSAHRMLVRVTIFATLLTPAASAHDPAREQPIALASLLLLLCIDQVLLRHNVFSSIGRNHGKDARARRIDVLARPVAGAGSGAR